MGGNRRNRGSQHHQTTHGNSNQQNYSHSRSSDLSNHSIDERHSNSMRLNHVLQEADGGYYISWREGAMILAGIFLLILISIFVGLSAGMTISVHFHESQAPLSLRQMDPNDASQFLYNRPATFQKVTRLDPYIASTNVLQYKDRDGVDLGKVVTTSASGQLNVLMVGEEVTPLHVGGGSKPKSSTINGNEKLSQIHSTMGHGRRSHDDANYIPLTTYQADLLVPGYTKWKESQPSIVMREPTVLPTKCSDGRTVGFDDWHQLKAAVQEANSISAERFMKWSAYFASLGQSFAAFEDDNLYYEEDVIFTICPQTTLKARRGPIYINAENVIIECEGCIIDVKGTHLNFGPHAKNVLVRGVTFRGAKTSSLTFFNDGAEANFEDCLWEGNSGASSKYGSVADVNSTSYVNFYRCKISEGSQVTALGAGPRGKNSYLTIRA